MGGELAANGHDQDVPSTGDTVRPGGEGRTNGEGEAADAAQDAAPAATVKPAAGQKAFSSEPSIRATALSEITVRFTLICGGLTHVQVPVAIAGRYDGLPLAGGTKAFDQILDTWLTRALDLGMIGSGLGQLFPINLQSRYDEGKVCAHNLLLANMGEPGRFARDDLRFLLSNITVAVKGLRQDLFAIPLLGTRRNELPVEDAVRGFLEGIVDGYDRFAAIASAVTDHREQFAQAAERTLSIILVDDDKNKLKHIRNALKIVGGENSLPRLRLYVEEGADVPLDKVDDPNADDTGPAVQTSLMRVLLNKSSSTAADAETNGATVFQFSGLSESAVVPVREETINPYLARELPARMSSMGTSGSERAALSVFFTDCLIPDDFRRTIESASNITLEVDESTAAYPWEMLARRSYSRTSFLGTEAAVSRQFRTLLSPPPSSPPPLNNSLRVLVIADPAPGKWHLPQARLEAMSVVDVLDHARTAWHGKYDIKATVRIGSKSCDDAGQDDALKLDKLLEQLRSRKDCVESAETCDPLEIVMLVVRGNYDVIHYAGHGFFEQKSGRAGWVLAEDCLLTATEIFRVRQVPRLVFANACFSAAMAKLDQAPTAELDHNQQRSHLAGLAQAFFARGIPNFIGTGWQVDDACARECARWFYAKALGLSRPDKTDADIVTSPPATIGYALRDARQNTLKLKDASSSWGAYQHYGRVADKLLPLQNVTVPADDDNAGATAGNPAAARGTVSPPFPATAAAVRTPAAAGEPDPSLVYVNGIDLVTGTYAVPPTTIANLAKQVFARPGLQDFEALHVDTPRSFGLVFGVDSTKLDEAGWGIVFHEATPDDVRTALEPLMKLRKQQAGDRFKVLEYKAGEQARSWYQRYRISAGNLDPEVVPYYLLLVGPPDLIPFEFQYLLSVEYGVGRLAFAAASDYQRYAQSIVDYERAATVPNAKEIAYWGTRHQGDPATNMSASMLIDPLANGVPGAAGALKRPIHAEVGYGRQLCLGDEASKERLLASLHAAKPPAFLFTASHGMAVPSGNAKQATTQGALLCQDWPGFGSVRPEHFLAAADIADDANVNGLVALLFACFGNGTPDQDQFPMDLSQAANAPPLAPKPFIAALPQRLLTHPKGSALAVIGHIDRAWGFSIQASKVMDPQIGPFRNSLGFILNGAPIGYALGGNFGARYASLSTALASATSPTAPASTRLSDRDLVTLWLERNDAQNYLLLGDPAARIRKDSFA
jgi:CHAT domain